jgi:hypothetical protein
VKKFEIPFIYFGTEQIKIGDVSKALDVKKAEAIDVVPWPAYQYKPIASFSIGHNGQNIFLKYYVEESAITAVHRQTNGPVYKDSCVEFFIGFDDGMSYYNLEFNCAGSCRLGYGVERDGRLAVPNCVVEKINHQVVFQNPQQDNRFTIKWELSLVIPIDVFYYHRMNTLEGKSFRMNLFKCGDDLPQPHYLSWTNLSTPIPNFHLPEAFRSAYFANFDSLLPVE